MKKVDYWQQLINFVAIIHILKSLTMKKVLYTIAIGALTFGAISCSCDNSKNSSEEKIVKDGIAEGTQVVVQPQESMIKEVVEGAEGKPITIETARGKMHGQIEFPGAITLTDPAYAKNVISKLTPAQGRNTYNCAVLFTGTIKKGKIWNFTHNPITVDVEWKYEDGSTSNDQVVVESQKYNFTYADEAKGNTKTITYTVK